MSFSDAQANRNTRQARSYVKMPTEAWVQHLASVSQDPVTDEVDAHGGDFMDSETEAESDNEDAPTIEPEGAELSNTAEPQASDASKELGPNDTIATDSPAILDNRIESASAIPENALPVMDATQTRAFYRELPPYLEIKTSKTTGRGIYSKAPIPAGKTIISVKPRVHVLSTAQLESYCSTCCSPPQSTGLKRCPNCKVVWYCGSACQTADWGMHKIECDALRKWTAEAPQKEDSSLTIPSDALRCLSRLIWARTKDGPSGTFFKETEAMQSQRENLPAETTEPLVHLAYSLVRYLQVDGQSALAKYNINGVGELVDLLSKFTTNAFTLTTPTLSPIGVTISPVAALINHSCDPNVAIVFPKSASPAMKTPKGKVLSEPILRVVALKDIPSGSELLTSYIDTTLPTAQRRKALKETYNFICKCSLCKAIGNDLPVDRREAVWCPKKCGGTCLIPDDSDSLSRCDKCKSAIRDNDSILDAARIGQQALDKATSLQFSEPSYALTLTTKIIPILTSHNFTPSSHPLLALNNLRRSLLIASFPTDGPPSKELLDDAIRTTAQTIAGVTEILREGNPVRAITLAEFAKLLAVDEPQPNLEDSMPQTIKPANANAQTFPPTGEARLRAAKQALERAMIEARIGFGKEDDGGEVGKGIRASLVDVEKELGIWSSFVRDAVADARAAAKVPPANVGS